MKENTAKAFVTVSRLDIDTLPLAYFGGVVCNMSVKNIRDNSNYLLNPVDYPCFERYCSQVVSRTVCF